MKNFLSLALLYLLFGCQQNSIDTATSETQKLNELVLEIKDCFDTPGLAVGILKDGEVYYKEAYGVRDLNGKDPLTTKSIFHMASFLNLL